MKSENTEIVRRRSEKLGIDHICADANDKSAELEAILKTENCSWGEVAYIGDDLNDLGVMQRVGIAVTVPEGDDTLKKIVRYVTQRRGGDGAVREVCDLILIKHVR
jgi:3-deoxy-D-manno-octulosonate 8-phosphate phosphatase (KDO 8-P phosphatase)